ncbi:helix-turn-helix transcriptional regulator [Paenibacillus sp. NPDC056579]|uniref:helix-turn-helix transcriptional regulator n=1 Tax=Paenibacillus sp. NPDC056579 TaxID=3345871 RepID=UPI0036BB5B08
MNKTQRLIALILTLNSRKKYTVKQLAEELNVSRRTMLRDLQELGELGIPLYSEMGSHGGYQVLKERTLPPIAFTENEAIALFFACQSLQNYRQLPFESESRSALNKFFNYLPRDTQQRISELQSKLLFWVPPHDYDTPYLRQLLNAALDRQALSVTYASENASKQRDIQPMGLYSMNGIWYCPSIDCDTGKVLTLRAERFRNVEPSQRTYQRDRLDKLTVKDFILWEDETEEALPLEVALTARGVLRCRSDLWLSQGLTIEEDGSGHIVRQIRPSFLPRAATFFLSLSKDAVVQQPDALLQLMKSHIEELQSLYMKEN